MDVKTQSQKISLLSVLDSGGLKDRLNNLIVDSMKDPLDRFNMGYDYIRLVKDLDHDYNNERYIINLESSTYPEDMGYLNIRKHHQDRACSLSFYLMKEYRNQGILTGLVDFIGTRCFQQLGYNRISAECTSLNKPALKIYRVLLKEEGVRREASYYNSQYVDVHEFGILKRESKFK